MAPLDCRLEPFWLSTTMHDESVVLIGSDDGAATARLLFQPDEVLAVNSAAAEVSYVLGDDYRIDQQARRIIRLPDSRMPWVTREALARADGELTHGRTVAVTYRHGADRWRAFAPSSAGIELPRATQRLRRGEPLTICLTGDSISEGYDASGFHGVPPHQPPFGALVASGLEQRYGAPVDLHNFATGGWTAADALWELAPIAAARPHLVVVAFGMNDAGYADAAEYVSNVSSILSRIKDDVPEAEFIVVSPMLPTPECEWLVHARFREYRDVLAGLTGEGVALADMTTLWSGLVARKDPHDLSGNGWNHPNDFGHRIYAQAILAMMGAASDAA